jgi:maltose alpha-D-glucosyltransferase/alpha-amylase
VALIDSVEWQHPGGAWLVALTRVESENGEAQIYFLPLTLAWNDGSEEQPRALAPLSVAKIRQQAQVGVMADAFGDDAFCRALVAAIGAGTELGTAHGRIRFTPTRRLAASPAMASRRCRSASPAQQQHRRGAGRRFFLKAYRRLHAGESRSRDRTLSDGRRGFRAQRSRAGTVDYVGNDGRAMTLPLLQAYTQNQGDGWTMTINYLEQFLDRLPAPAEAAMPAQATAAADHHGGYLALVRTLGARTAELHAALAGARGDRPCGGAPSRAPTWRGG